MAIAYPHEIFSEVMDFLVTSPSPNDIIAFKPSSKLEGRLSELLSKKQDAALTDDEQAELAEFLRLNHFMNMLKIRARQKLAPNTSP
jgi:hypothetical protein